MDDPPTTPGALLKAARRLLGWRTYLACACAGDIICADVITADGPFCGIITNRRLRRCELDQERVPPKVWPILDRALAEYAELHWRMYPGQAQAAANLRERIARLETEMAVQGAK